MGVFFSKDVEMLNVIDDPKHPGYGIGFAKYMFKKKKEWAVLKKFCQKHDIWQTDLNRVFKRFLSGPQVYLREFRVCTTDTKNYFNDYSLAMRELADIMIPFIYFKAEKGLPIPKGPVNMEEVSFTRFIVRVYKFCAQPLSDCVFDFFCIVRQNMNMKLRAVMYSFNLLEMLKVLMSECRNSACKQYILSRVNLEDDTEMTIATIVKLSIRYPEMFYLLERFRVHLRRQVFGDRFWVDRPVLPTSLDQSQLWHEKAKVHPTMGKKKAAGDDDDEDSDDDSDDEAGRGGTASTGWGAAKGSGRTPLDGLEPHGIKVLGDGVFELNEAVAKKKGLEQAQAKLNAAIEHTVSLRNAKRISLSAREAKFVYPVTVPVAAVAKEPARAADLNEDLALKLTARSIITDIFMAVSTSTVIPLMPVAYDVEVNFIDDTLFIKLKNALGYRRTRLMVQESQLPFVGQVPENKPIEVHTTKALSRKQKILGFLGMKREPRIERQSTKKDIVKPKPSSQFFMHLPKVPDIEQRVYDPLVKQDFIYNSGTGLRAWVLKYSGSETNELFRETWHKTAPTWADFKDPTIFQEDEVE